MKKKISVIIPCYNREKYIRKCVESLCSQTFPFQYMELIFVDDASTDSTVEILKEYEGKYPDNIIIVTNEMNSGFAGKMRNIGMMYATGDYISFVDSDDYISKYAYENMYEIIKREGADIVTGSAEMFSENEGTIYEAKKPNKTYHTELIEDFQELLANEEKNGFVWGKLYKKSFLDEKGLRFPEDKHIGEDHYFTMHCLFSVEIYTSISDVVYFYRRNEGGLWHSNSIESYIDEMFMIQEELYPLYLSKPEGIWELVEWFYYLCVLTTRRKCYGIGAKELYHKRLPYMRMRLKEMVPSLKRNRFVLQQRGEEAELIFKEIFGDSPYIVDVLLPSAKQGGPENIINMLCNYCMGKKIRIRIIQMVYGGFNWVDKGVEFHYIYPEGIDQTETTFVLGYMDFLSHREKPDLVLATSWPIMSYVAMKVKYKLGLNFIIVSWLHASVMENEKMGYGGIESLQFADYHFAISERIEAEESLWIPDARIIRVLNPVSKAKVHEISREPEQYKLSYIGRISPIKRIDLIIEALIKTEDPWRLIVIGDGQVKSDLVDMVKKWGLSGRVSFLGWTEDPWMEARDSAFTILASDYDCYPMTVIESLANGVPVLATPCGGVTEIISEGENGYYFQKNDPESLTILLNKIASGILNRPDGEKCRETVEYNMEDVALSRTYDEIEKLICG